MDLQNPRMSYLGLNQSKQCRENRKGHKSENTERDYGSNYNEQDFRQSICAFGLLWHCLRGGNGNCPDTWLLRAYVCEHSSKKTYGSEENPRAQIQLAARKDRHQKDADKEVANSDSNFSTCCCQEY